MSSFAFDHSLDAGVATITLNRPDRLNALTFEIYAQLRDYFAGLQTDENTHAVIITGEGRGFCSGGDVEDIIGKLIEMDPKGVLDFARMTGALIENMRNCRTPIIAAINGAAAGAGAVIGLAADLRILADEGKFVFLFPRVGLCGADMGAAYLLPRVVGLGRASEYLLFGNSVKAEECYRVGLANKVVPKAELMSTATEWARRLADGPRGAHSLTKEMLQRETDMGLAESIEAEAQAQTLLMTSADFREAYHAFVEKREPKWTGR